MKTNLKDTMLDFDTYKVLAAASLNLADWVAGLETGLRIIIAILTIWYLWRKIHPGAQRSARPTIEDDEALEDLQ